LATDGYILLRNVLDRKQIFSARSVVVDILDKEWNLIDTKHTKIDAFIKDKQKGILLTGFRAVTHHKNVLNVLEGDTLSTLFRKVFGLTPATFDNKWVRIHGNGEFTDEHTDYYRFQGNAVGMHTCWIPLGDYDVTDGTLAVCEGSHLLPGYDLNSYAESKMELPKSFTHFNQTAIWRSTDFRAGDIVIFDIRTIHASTKNLSDRFRISMDTRWQPARNVPEKCRTMFRKFRLPDEEEEAAETTTTE